MEDFDYIDALAKKALSDRTVEPSAEGWTVVQQQMKRKKRKRFFIYIVLFALLCSLGIFVGINSGTAEDASISNQTTKTEHIKPTTTTTNNNNERNTISNSDSTSIVNDASQAGTNTAAVATEEKNQHPTTNNVHGEKNGLAQTQTKHHSRFVEKDRNSTATTINASSFTYSESQLDKEATSSFLNKDGGLDSLNAAGIQLYNWELIQSDMLTKKRKTKNNSKKPQKIYEQLDVMVGFNGFTRPNDYNFTGSYVVELSYTDEKKLKNDYFFKYGASLQFRNLRFKKDSISFNKGELSINIHSAIEKRFGNFGIEAGPYLGYELHSPNNEFFNNNTSNFFEEKINYGLFSIFHYKKVGLVFKYEFSPYINYLGTKEFGAFTIGVKYDF
ncbi:hypothetical protein KORDIASMS9_00436 [Kordia sp. SMS9]|uniref:hypothetical protein n=1 Tax=Kordia sp. SMS9 TaxID=2282170 RepID=UPI000E0D85B1|nr:hypothetical protein [Kordia sp. SMS9]AXG68243.1 hypothetical protein KORDIASMS9_00436 [Kordia sp. SMS9]